PDTMPKTLAREVIEICILQANCCLPIGERRIKVGFEQVSVLRRSICIKYTVVLIANRNGHGQWAGIVRAPTQCLVYRVSYQIISDETFTQQDTRKIALLSFRQIRPRTKQLSSFE